jgi:hypothetical protein
MNKQSLTPIIYKINVLVNRPDDFSSCKNAAACYRKLAQSLALFARSVAGKRGGGYDQKYSRAAGWFGAF